MHFGKPWPANQHKGTRYQRRSGNLIDDFHTFSLEWEKGAMRWFVDDELYQTQTKWHSEGGEFPAPFDQRFHLIMNLAVGGNFVGKPDNSTQFPRQFLVDFVRVYERESMEDSR